ITLPVVYDRELWQPHRQLRHDDALENAHVGKFISYFKANVVAKECVKEFELIFRFRLLSWFHWVQFRRAMKDAQQNCVNRVYGFATLMRGKSSTCRWALKEKVRV